MNISTSNSVICSPVSIVALVLLFFITGAMCHAEDKDSGVGVYIAQEGGTRYVLILYSDGAFAYYVARANGPKFDRHLGGEGHGGHFWKRNGKTITLLNGQVENAEYYVDGADLIEVKVTAPLEAKEFAARGPGRRYVRVAKLKEALP